MPKNKVQLQKGLSSHKFLEVYGNEDNCRNKLYQARWPHGYKCPQCSHSHCGKPLGIYTMIGNVKRSIHGTYHSVSSKHLPRYLAEFNFRFNNRFQMGSMIDFFIKHAAIAKPLPHHKLKLAEDWGVIR